MERFGNCTNENILELVNKSKNINTSKATNNWMGVYLQWAGAKGKETCIEKLSPEILDVILQQFYAEIRKKNGQDYEPNSLAAMQAGLDRHLKEKGYKYSLLTHREFSTSRSVLEGKAKLLREEGRGKRPNKSCSVSKEEVEKLWESRQFGCHSPQALINTLWWLFTLHFGLRGRQEHHTMKVEDFTFRTDDRGTEYVTFAEGITKTRQSGLHEKHRLTIPKMFATNTDRCPVQIFKFYLSKRPFELRNNGPFYLSVIINPSSEIWYKKISMGINTINNLMKKMIKNSSLCDTDKKITNHSARKTLIKTLKQNKTPKSEIITITGHSTEAGLDAYDSGDEEQQKAISFAIDNHTPKPPKRSKLSSNHIVSPDNPCIQHPCFNFFPNQNPIQLSSSSFPSAQLSSFNFHNCSVNFVGSTSGLQQQNNQSSSKRKRVRVIESSDSSQE